MKKTIALILTLMLIISLGLTVSAEGADAYTPSDLSSVSEGNDTNKPSEKENENNEDTTLKTEDGGDISLSDNPFAALLEAFRDYLPEILGVLTFTGSLVLAFLYKRGLIPIVKASLSTLTGIVGEVKEQAESDKLLSQEQSEALKERLGKTEMTLSLLTDSFEELSSQLSSAEERSLDRASLTALMTTQVELLYDIFMSSSIPQFQKELVGESVAKMKEALGGNENTES